MLLALLALLAASPAPAPDVDPRDGWAVGIDAGVQALGFAPIPANPTVAVEAERNVLVRRFYALHIGGALGGFHQIGLMRGVTLDARLGQRFTARPGPYAQLDLVVGGQLTSGVRPTYGLTESGVVGPVRPPVHGNARLGLALSLGMDLRRLTRAPLRVFVRYRQLVLTPFMRGNDLPAMGLATLTAGFTLELGRWTPNDRRSRRTSSARR